MKINKQTNFNKGDVINIEKIENSINNQYIDLPSHFSEQKIVSAEDVVYSKFKKVGVFLVGGIGFAADVSELIPGLNLPWWLWFLGVALGLAYFSSKYSHTKDIAITKRPQVQEDGTLIVLNENKFTLGKSEAPCIYPNCPGLIVPIEAPENYGGPYELLGICSKAGIQHGYVIDNNLQAYPSEIFN